MGEGIENILLVGKRCFDQNGLNPFAQYVEECGGVDSLEELQSNQAIPDEIYDKAQKLVCDFFNGEEIIGPNVDMFVSENGNGSNNNNNNNAFGNQQQQQNGNGNMFGFGMSNNNNNGNQNGNAPTFNF